MPTLDEIVTKKKKGKEEDEDSIEKFIRRMDKDLVADAERERIKEYIVDRKIVMAEKQRKLDEVLGKKTPQSETQSGESDQALLAFVSSDQWKNMKQEDQEKTIYGYQALKQAGKVSEGTAGGWGIIPLLMMFTQKNPQSSGTDVVRFGESLMDNLSRGIDIGQKMSAHTSQTDPVQTATQMLTSLMGFVKDIQGQNKPVDAETTFLKSVLSDEGMFNRFSNLFGKSGTSDQVTVEMKRLDLELEKMKQMHQLDVLKLQGENTKWTALAEGGKRFARTLGAAVAEGTFSAEGGQPPSGQVFPKTEHVVQTSPCPFCQSPISIVDAKAGKAIQCPRCKKNLTWGAVEETKEGVAEPSL